MTSVMLLCMLVCWCWLLLYVYLLWLICLACFVFFFFKQKTAYEMRISDWSSDVCSSDLFRLGPAHIAGTAEDLHGFRGAEGHGLRRLVFQQIGRASCRERVCQYV